MAELNPSENDRERESSRAPDGARIASIAGLALFCFGACTGILSREMGLGHALLPYWLAPLEAKTDFERFSMQGPAPTEDEREALRRMREQGSPLGGGAA